MEVIFLYYFHNGYFIFLDTWLHSEAIFSTPILTMYRSFTGNQLPENFVKHVPSSGRRGRKGVILKKTEIKLILFHTNNREEMFPVMRIKKD